MNGYSVGRASPSSPEPQGKVLLEAYRKDIVNGFEPQAPRYNPMNTERMQSSALVDLKDPIQVHLLTETALSDSKKYEVLSQEEVDDLKRQCQSLSQRIDSTRANLLIQSKYRDAAISMSRLYSPGKGEGGRRSMLGGRFSGDQKTREAEMERQASERRCEELASELFNLEKRLMEPHRRLLEHTAGILQLTHKALKKKPPPLNGQLNNGGIPGSPESLYTYAQDRNSLEVARDDVGIYLFDDFDGLATRNAKKDAIEIPPRSPNREQTSQLREEIEKLREENGLLRVQADNLSKSTANVERLRGENDKLLSQIDTLAKSLSDTRGENTQLRGRADGMARTQPSAEKLQEENSGLRSDTNELVSYLAGVEQTLERLNGGLQQIVIAFNPDANGSYQDPPRVAPTAGSRPTESVQVQLEYLDECVAAVRAEQQAKDGSQDSEAVLVSLWGIMQSELADIKQQKVDRRRARLDKGLEDDEAMSDTDDLDTSEPYSLDGFATRIQWLWKQATTLKDQKAVLKRQIKQQRELNNKSDAEKDEELRNKQDELENSRVLLDRAEKDAMDAQRMLSDALQDLERSREEVGEAQSVQTELQERGDKAQILESKLLELQQNLDQAESDSKGTMDRLARFDQALAALNVQLDDATRTRDAAQTDVTRMQTQLDEASTHKQSVEDRLMTLQIELDEKAGLLKQKEDDMELLNMTLVELKTELTFARAELDGAYGSRAERAADAAAIKSSVQVSGLQSQVDGLRKELAETVKELEDMTKETIGSEREKIDLEGKLDDALAIKTSLESQLDEALASRSTFEAELLTIRERSEGEAQRALEKIARLEEELDGERLKAVPGQGGASRPGAGASMLSEQFRATMREERKKFQEDIREERARARRLEEELNKLKRAQGPGKSPLSPR